MSVVSQTSSIPKYAYELSGADVRRRQGRLGTAVGEGGMTGREMFAQEQGMDVTC